MIRRRDPGHFGELVRSSCSLRSLKASQMLSQVPFSSALPSSLPFLLISLSAVRSLPHSRNYVHSLSSPSSTVSSNPFFQFVNCECLNIFLDTSHRNRPTFLQAKEGYPYPRCRTLKFPLRHRTHFQCHRSTLLLPATTVAANYALARRLTFLRRLELHNSCDARVHQVESGPSSQSCMVML
jgi:hypothetical protein